MDENKPNDEESGRLIAHGQRVRGRDVLHWIITLLIAMLCLIVFSVGSKNAAHYNYKNPGYTVYVRYLSIAANGGLPGISIGIALGSLWDVMVACLCRVA